MDVNPDRRVGAEKTAVRTEGLDAVRAALRAADEIAAALQAAPHPRARRTRGGPFADVAKELFAGYGSPGGTASAPKVPDPPFVLGLPPQEHDDV